MRTISWYYTYYIGYKDKNDVLYPLGMFDYTGYMHPVFSKSRSFASDLHEIFIPIKSGDMISDELMKAWRREYYDSTTKDDLVHYVSYCPVSQLKYRDITKRGYYLIEDIERYLKDEYGDLDEIFYDYLSPELYAIKMESEQKFGPPPPTTDCEGYEYTPHSVRDYAYFVYIDHNSVEYETNQLLDAVDVYDYVEIPEGAERVIILSQG